MSLLKFYGLAAATAMLSGEWPGMKMSEQERRVSNARIDDLVKEYNLIQDKKSKLSRKMRDMIEVRIERLIASGHLTKLEDGKVSIPARL